VLRTGEGKPGVRKDRESILERNRKSSKEKSIYKIRK
jgi:hypothetical protein